MQRVFTFALMMLSRFRVALVLPLAFGCAHAVYDGQPDGSELDNSVTDQPVTSHAGASNRVVSRAGSGNTAGETSDLGSGGETAESGGATGIAGSPSGSAGKSSSAGSTSTAGSGSGSTPGSAGAPTASGGAPSAGAPSGGAPNAGASSGGASSGGAATAGAPSGGASSTSCTGVLTWAQTPYTGGDLVQAGGKLYKCKTGAESGWCGVADAYAPGTGYAWKDAWDLVGAC